jgi:threonine synthase
MKYKSTNNKSPEVHFEEAIHAGIAPDGGLYVPTSIPTITRVELESIVGKGIQHVAEFTLQKWFGQLFTRDEVKEIVKSSLNFPMPIIEVSGYKIFELFHGPTHSFSDISSRLMTHISRKLQKKKDKKSRIIMATSGDSGSAIAHSFGTEHDQETIIVFPSGSLSAVQLAQITKINERVVAIEVEGDFEECQTLVHMALGDESLSQYNLISASSMSIGRLIPQTVIYTYLYSELSDGKMSIVIPSGNFGNASSALLARLMGIPMNKIVIACNKNDAAVQYSKTGKFSPKPTVTTISNAMDIGNPHNFPRILHFCDYDHKKFKNYFDAFTVADSKIIHTINAVWSEYNYLLDPHTAVAWAAADEIDASPSSTVIVATASPKKFAETIHKSTGISVDNTDVLSIHKGRKSRHKNISSDYEELRQILIAEIK